MIADAPRGHWLQIVLPGIVVALAVAVRVAWIAYANVNPLDGRADDTVFYYLQGRALAHDLAYRNLDGSYTAHWPPGYPLALAGAFAVAGTHLLVAKVLNVALSAATVALAYMIGARVFGRGTGLLAAVLLALSPGHAYFSSFVMAEVLFCFGFLAVVGLLVWWTIHAGRAGWPQLLALGFATGWLTLVRAEGVFLPFIFVLLWKAVLPGWRPALRYCAIFGLGFAIALTPWTARNALRFHEFLPIRDSSQSGLANGLDRNYPHRPDRFTAPAPPLDETAGYMARHPWELVPLELAKLRYLYQDDSDGIAWLQHDNHPLLTAAEVRRWSDVADWYFFAVGLGALAATPLLLRAPDRRRSALAYVVVAWTGALIVAWPETRYHLPLTPLLCLFAAWTIASASGWLFALRRGAQPPTPAPPTA